VPEGKGRVWSEGGKGPSQRTKREAVWTVCERVSGIAEIR